MTDDKKKKERLVRAIILERFQLEFDTLKMESSFGRVHAWAEDAADIIVREMEEGEE